MNSGFKVGTVAIVGRPNVGKSTLLNALINQKVAAVSSKPQTTQRLIHAYVENEQGQVFFLDTPGLFEGKNREQMEKLIKEALAGADLLIYVIDHTREWGREEDVIFDLICKIDLPILMVVNKIDIKSPSFLREYINRTRISEPIKISAINSNNMSDLLKKVFDSLPEGRRIKTVDEFPTPILSQNSKEYLSEIIRAKIYQFTNEEVPYQCKVEVTEVKSNKKDLRVTGVIKVLKDRYKGILIGRNGNMVKRIGIAVRKELEVATDKHVRVSLLVKA